MKNSGPQDQIVLKRQRMVCFRDESVHWWDWDLIDATISMRGCFPSVPKPALCAEHHSVTGSTMFFPPGNGIKSIDQDLDMLSLGLGGFLQICCRMGAFDSVACWRGKSPVAARGCSSQGLKLLNKIPQCVGNFLVAVRFVREGLPCQAGKYSKTSPFLWSLGPS